MQLAENVASKHPGKYLVMEEFKDEGFHIKKEDGIERLHCSHCNQTLEAIKSTLAGHTSSKGHLSKKAANLKSQNLAIVVKDQIKLVCSFS